jgi:hypothetical protein
MKRKLLNLALIAAVVFSMGRPLFAQRMIATPEQVRAMGGVTGPEVQAVLQKALDNLGYADVKTLVYHSKGNGMIGAPGQQYSWIDDMPRFQTNNYVRTTNFETGQTCEEYDKQQGLNYPPHGGGGTPLIGVHHWKSCVVGDYAWDVVDGKVIPQVNGHLYGSPETDFRKLDGIICTPVGFLKAAMAPGAKVSMLSIKAAASPANHAGLTHAVALEALGQYRVVGMIDSNYTVEAIFTFIGNPIYGELPMQYRYTRYGTFNGKKYPVNLHIHQGDGGIGYAHNSADENTGSIEWNVPVAPVSVPEEVKNAKSTIPNVESKKLAEGVWLICGSDVNSVAIEFKDFVTVFEAPMNEQRSIAVIAEINKLVPNKPIKYVVNSSFHWESAGGLRTYYTQGTSIITSQYNKDYYDKILFNYVPDRPILEDRYSYYYITPGAARSFNAQYVDHGNYIISDGEQNMEIYSVQGPLWFSTEEKDVQLSTATRDVKQFDVVGMLAAYLPKSHILLTAELYKPEKPGDPPPPADNNMTMLLQAVQSHHMNVDQVVSMDSPYVATLDQLKKTVGSAPPAAPAE